MSWEGLPPQKLKSPKEEVFQSLALTLLLGSSQLSPELHPLQDSNPVEAAGWSCESRG